MKSLDTTELCKKLDHKAVIFDTNILLESSTQTEAFAEIFGFIQRCKCQPQYFPFIEFEFFERTHQKELIEQKRAFLEALNIESLPTGPLDRLIREAIAIANLYASHGKGSMGIVDSCIAALLERYRGNLFLLTTNHSDFNEFLFDRLFLYPLAHEKSILNLGFYEFNSEKVKVLKERERGGRKTKSKTEA